MQNEHCQRIILDSIRVAQHNKGMQGIFTIFVVVFSIAIIILLMMLLSGSKTSKRNGKKSRIKDRNTIVRNATRKLSQNPRDPDALSAMADIYYQESDWEKAHKMYETLMPMTVDHPILDSFEIHLKGGLAALKLQHYEEALKALMIARSINNDNFEVNYSIGFICYQKQEYEKAIPFLRQSILKNDEQATAQKYLGCSMHKSGKHRDALPYLKRAIDLMPEDKESLFIMAECLYDMNTPERALKIFSHLRPDPTFGPQSALYAGMIHSSAMQYELAIEDFDIGLKHESMDPNIRNEIMYRMALSYLKMQEIGKALQLLRNLQAVVPGYKDITTLIGRYQELNANRNLQVYLLASQGDFATLCRKIVIACFPKASIKIVDIQVSHDHADILADIETSKWQDLIMFRFFRSTGSVGELVLREFHARIKDTKAGKAYCFTAGAFSQEAKNFVEARLIDLVEKDKLIAILHNIDIGKQVSLVDG